MASLILAKTTASKILFAANFAEHGSQGMLYANAAIEFAALGQLGLDTRYHLFALAIELAFKSLALRVGATPDECRTANHKISKMIGLIENHGLKIPDEIKQRLNNDECFKSIIIDARYPQWGTGPIVHSNYPEMVAQILEISCDSPLSFEGGSASAEIEIVKQKATKGLMSLPS